MFVFARSGDLALDVVPLVREAVERLGGKGGGGKPDFAQGGGPPASEEQVRADLQSISDQLSAISLSTCLLIDHDTRRLTMKQIAPHIYVHDGYRGVTVGCIITPHGPICIDSPTLPSDARDWRARIAKLSDKPVRMVVLTDAHRDRILGVQYLGGIVVAHDLALGQDQEPGRYHSPAGRRFGSRRAGTLPSDSTRISCCRRSPSPTG